MAERPRYYWDACAWIALIKQEAGRFDDLNFLVDQARAKTVEIWTSAFTLAEVFKRQCDSEKKGLTIVDDTSFEDLILQDWVMTVQVDYHVGQLARRLLRAYPGIAKPQDAIHLATALLHNLDEVHTFDRKNLTDLNGKIQRKDGKSLRICAPPKKPAPTPDNQMSLLDNIDKAQEQGGTEEIGKQAGAAGPS
ncbi:type II toxin-antitoxin system VapC family toxin [Bradyrhizobium sp. SZCCHNS3051]|uniref:type II toxin-antitoxin system VapC family toxin n=1 Tax=Bradyrhizobium TaxID=374 RepID=UPI002916965B|nr:PIN domain-containing protein [Bradyrhizobium sp. SZCCHNS3051]